MDPELAALEAEAAALDQQLNATVPAMQTPMYTPAPAAPAPDQLQSLIDQPTRAPTDVELGVARLRAMSPLERTAAELEGRKLLFQEGLSFGVLPKVGAAATSLKEALYGKPLTEAFGEATTQQDILKEYVRQKALAEQDLVLGMTGPELAGGLLSPIDKLYRPLSVARGAPLTQALATRGLNVAQAAGTGAGAAGLQTFLSTPGTVEERLAAAAPAAETGALFGGGFGGLGEIAGMAAPAAKSFGLGLQKKSLGLRKANLTNARNAILSSEEAYGVSKEAAENLTQTQVTKSLNRLIEKDWIDPGMDPATVYETVVTKQNQIEESIQKSLQAVDQSGKKITMPSFSNARKFIKENRVDITDIEQYENIIKDFESAVKNESKFIEPELPTIYDEYGNVVSKTESPAYQKALKEWQVEQGKRSKLSLDVLNKQKKVFGEKYRQGPQSNKAFWRAFYRDIKEHIEKYAPEVKSLNKLKQDFVVARPIVEQAMKRAEDPATMQDIRRMLLFTTGGLGVFGAQQLTGSDTLGAALALGLGVAGTRKGQNLVGQALRKGNMPAAITNLGLLSGQLTSRPTVEPMFATEVAAATEDEELAALEAEAKALDEQLGAAKTKTAEAPKVQVGKQDVSIPVGEGYAPPNLVKAIMQVESSFNPKAVSPKGAAGLMQLMPGTARDLGVTDRFDPQQNVDAGSRYLAQQLKKFNSVELTAAAYNWGPRRVANAVAKLKAEGIPVTWENMVKEVKVPAETQNYVRKVTKLLQA